MPYFCTGKYRRSIFKCIMIGKEVYLSKRILWLMAVGAGLVVANNYYNQPLLGLIAKDLNESGAATSKIAMFTQIGYASGLLLLIPLGDMFKRKKIILIDFVFMIASLLMFAFGGSLTSLVVSSFLIGFTSVVPQIFIPIAAQLSAPADKDKHVGLLMSGLLIGILGSRVFSGVLGDLVGWRIVFMIAAGIMVVLGFFIASLLPEVNPTFHGSYKQLLKSIAVYAKSIPGLQLASLRGALVFASFSVFWTTLTFLLEDPPFFAGSDVAGLLGLIGIVGAVSASSVGYISRGVTKRTIITGACLIMLLSWGIFGFWGDTYPGLIIGIVFLDMGLQGVNVTNQTIVFSYYPEAANRLNTVYMVSYFLGGSLGTLLAGEVWGRFGWNGVVWLGGFLVLACLAVHVMHRFIALNLPGRRS